MGLLVGLFAKLFLPMGLSERAARIWGSVTLAAVAFGFLWAVFGALKAKYDADLIAEYERGVQEGILSTVEEADGDAIEAVEGRRNDVEDENERARDAASKSDDPLGASMRELRR